MNRKISKFEDNIESTFNFTLNMTSLENLPFMEYQEAVIFIDKFCFTTNDKLRLRIDNYISKCNKQQFDELFRAIRTLLVAFHCYVPLNKNRDYQHFLQCLKDPSKSYEGITYYDRDKEITPSGNLSDVIFNIITGNEEAIKSLIRQYKREYGEPFKPDYSTQKDDYDNVELRCFGYLPIPKNYHEDNWDIYNYIKSNIYENGNSLMQYLGKDKEEKIQEIEEEPDSII